MVDQRVERLQDHSDAMVRGDRPGRTQDSCKGSALSCAVDPGELESITAAALGGCALKGGPGHRGRHLARGDATRLILSGLVWRFAEPVHDVAQRPLQPATERGPVPMPLFTSGRCAGGRAHDDRIAGAERTEAVAAVPRVDRMGHLVRLHHELGDRPTVRRHDRV